MQLFQLNRQVLLGSLLSVSFQSVPWIDWGDDNPSAEYLAQVQRDLIQSQERQFDGQTCTLSNGNILNARKYIIYTVYLISYNIGLIPLIKPIITLYPPLDRICKPELIE